MLAIPASAVALSAGQADAQGAIQINLGSRQLAFGQNLRVSGWASSAGAGQTLWLEFARGGNVNWQPVGSTKAGPNGHFTFNEALRQSGLVRVVASAATANSTTSTPTQPSTTGTLAPSPSRPFAVAPKFRLRSTSFRALGGEPIHVRGSLLPGRAGRRVQLQGRDGGRWHTLSSARTGTAGDFSLRYASGGLGWRQLRVGFAGDRFNTRAVKRAGAVMVFRQSVASWYSDGGATACGFHAGYGVANRTLPCGTKVKFSYGGRTVTAVVDDRGPFVGGREWDLNQNVAHALGFDGVGTVWSTS